MAIATTATAAELRKVKEEVHKLNIMLEDLYAGSGTPAKPGRFASTTIDTQLETTRAAIVAAQS